VFGAKNNCFFSFLTCRQTVKQKPYSAHSTRSRERFFFVASPAQKMKNYRTILALLMCAIFVLARAQQGTVSNRELFPSDNNPNKDEDHCAHLPQPCSENGDCKYELSGWQCVCRQGFSGDGYTCTDINECEQGNLLTYQFRTL